MKYYDNQFRWKVDIEYFYRISRNKNFVFLPFVVKTILNHIQLHQM